MLNSFRSIHRSLSLSLSLQISLFFSHAPWLARIFLLLLSGSQVSFTITGGGGQGSLFETLTISSSQSGRVSFHFNPIKGTGDLYPLWNKQIKDPTLETHICCCCCTHTEEGQKLKMFVTYTVHRWRKSKSNGSPVCGSRGFFLFFSFFFANPNDEFSKKKND